MAGVSDVDDRNDNQITTIRTTWAVLIEVVVDMTDAWNGPRLTVALGAVPVLDKECNVTAVAPIPSPTEPRPMATLAQAARLGWMPRCASRASTCLSISELILSISPSARASLYW